MSSPTERSEGTRTQDATHASSRQGADIAMEDTASSVAPRVPSPSVPRTRSPNTSFKGDEGRARTFPHLRDRADRPHPLESL